VAEFSQTKWRPSPGFGVPWLVDDAFAVAECLVTNEVVVADHTIVFAEVVGVQQTDATPLVYGMRRFSAWLSDVFTDAPFWADSEETMTTTAAGHMPMSVADLHGAVADPVLSSMNFLNEVMDRYPDAISMAPGAPHETFFADMDIGRYIDTFTRHLADRWLGTAAIRRVLYQYGPSRGQINDIITEALHRDEGIDVPPESLVVTVGAQEAIFLTLRVLHRDQGDAVAVVDPSYPGVLGAARLLDLPVVPVAGSADGLDLDQLRHVCETYREQGRRVRTLYVAPDFANPGGARIPLPARRRLLDEADRLDLMIIEDNAYGFTAAADARLPSLKSLDEHGRVVHVGTFAKICLPGARVGYVVADQPVHGSTTHLLADDIASAKSMITVNTSPVSRRSSRACCWTTVGRSRQWCRRKPCCTDGISQYCWTTWTDTSAGRTGSPGTNRTAVSSSGSGCQCRSTTRCWNAVPMVTA
jgi:aspartate/methionine/tyrosine aminotransferase